MGQLYGPAQLQYNTITPVAVDFAYRIVRLRNDSPFDVAVSFLPNRPALPGFISQGVAAAQTINTDWVDIVPARGVATIPVATGGQVWTGRVWLLPVDPSNAILYGTPTVGRMWVTAYSADETIPRDSISPSSHDIQRQQRVISVPITAFKNYSFQTPSLVVGGTTQPPFAPDICVGPPPGHIGSDGGWDGNGVLVSYLYSLDAYPSGDGFALWELQVVHTQVGNPGVVLRTDHFYYFFLSRLTSSGIMNNGRYQSPFPFALSVKPPQHTGISNIQVNLAASSTVNAQCVINMTVDTDNINQMQPPSIGFGENSTDGASTQQLPTTSF